MEEKASMNYFGVKFPVPRNTAASKIGNGVYDNSDVIATLIMTNLHLYLHVILHVINLCL